MLTLLALACSSDANGFQFGTGGERTGPFIETGSETGAETGDTAVAGGDGAPTLTDMALSWEDNANGGLVLRADVTYEDDEGDLPDGTAYVDIETAEGDDKQSFDLDIVVAADVDTTDAPAIIDEEGAFYFELSDIDDSQTWIVDVYVKDSAGKVSEPISGELAGE